MKEKETHNEGESGELNPGEEESEPSPRKKPYTRRSWVCLGTGQGLVPRVAAGDRSLKVLEEHGPLKNLIPRALRRSYINGEVQHNLIYNYKRSMLSVPEVVYELQSSPSNFQLLYGFVWGLSPDSKESRSPGAALNQRSMGYLAINALSPSPLGGLIPNTYFVPFLRIFCGTKP